MDKNGEYIWIFCQGLQVNENLPNEAPGGLNGIEIQKDSRGLVCMKIPHEPPRGPK